MSSVRQLTDLDEFPRWIGASYLSTKKQIINR